jgi:hypothetical protein
MNGVLFLSRRDDGHLAFVQRHLSQEPIVIDLQEVANGASLDYLFHKDTLLPFYNGVALSSCQSVWLRRPRTKEGLYIDVEPRLEKYAKSALTETFLPLYGLLDDAFWVSDRFAIYRAESKPLQQRCAAGLGLAVPDTVYTNNMKVAKAFIANHGQTIVKSLAHLNPHAKEKDRFLAFFSHKLKPGQPLDLSGLHLAPAVFQEAIDVDYELRVTVMASKVFSARVHMTDSKTNNVRDWRYGYYEDGVDFSLYKLPKDIEQKCVALVRELGLQYGAIDLIKDKKGIYWFLEINPNGQWAFVEEATGAPMGKTLARILESPPRN